MSRRIRTRLAVTLVLTALLAAFIATPVLAMSRTSGGIRAPHAVVRKPDGRIRLSFGTASGNPDPYVGNNVYNTTGAHQTSHGDYYGTSFPGDHYTFDISIQNDGTKADAFKVKATGAATSGWRVRYFRGTTNITSAVVGGSYRTSPLAPSATYVIKAKVTMVTLSAGPTRLVTITSAADAAKQDAVKFVLKLATCGC